MKVIQINGFRGLVTMVFVGICLFAGFVLFPGLVAKHFWNLYLVNLYGFPTLDLFQGVLVWAMMVITYAILMKNDFALSFTQTPHLSQEEIDSIIKKAKLSNNMKHFSKIVSKSDIAEFTKSKNVINPFNNREALDIKKADEDREEDTSKIL